MPAERPSNPYHFFLQIDADTAEPDHYELLGIPQFTSDPAVIRKAAVLRNSTLRKWDNTEYHTWANQLLDEIVQALTVLESPSEKAEYDRQLKLRLEGAAFPDAPSASDTTPPLDTLQRIPWTAALIGLLIVVPWLGWAWTAARQSESMLTSPGPELSLLIDGERLTPDQTRQLPSGRHTLTARLNSQVVATHELNIDALSISASRPSDPTNSASAEDFIRLQRESAERLALPVQAKNSIGMPFQLIPAGRFQMGSDDSLAMSTDESPRHLVHLTSPFFLSTYEVTQGNYRKVMGQSSPSQYREPEHPVTEVTWDEANQFCRRLSDLEKRRYRLPTEAEWEYACRAGTVTPWSHGVDVDQLEKFAWYGANSQSSSHLVGRRLPNPWGLYDLHGNVAEWCSDLYDSSYYQKSPLQNPTGPSQGTAQSTRISRGGHWESSAASVRSGYRGTNSSSVSSPKVGFRVVLEIDSPEVLR